MQSQRPPLGAAVGRSAVMDTALLSLGLSFRAKRLEQSGLFVGPLRLSAGVSLHPKVSFRCPAAGRQSPGSVSTQQTSCNPTPSGSPPPAGWQGLKRGSCLRLPVSTRGELVIQMYSTLLLLPKIHQKRATPSSR